MSLRHRSSGAALAAILAAATNARASGLDSPLITSGQSGPTTADAAAVFWNPAELGWIERPEVLGGGGLIVGHVGYTRYRAGRYQTPDSLQYRLPLDPTYIDRSKSGWADGVGATPIAPVGDFFFAIPVIKNRLVIGGGGYVPYAALVDFPDFGAQAWQAREAILVAAHATGSVALRLGDHFGVGAGVSYVPGMAEISRLQDFASVSAFHEGLANLGQENPFGPKAPTEVRELDTLSRPFSLTRAFAHGITFNAGISIHPTKRSALVASYQHGVKMTYKGDFAIDMNDTFFTRDLAAQGLKYPPLVKGDGKLEFSLPKRITVGAGYDVTRRLRIDAFGQYVFYSDLDAFVVTAQSPSLAQPKLGLGDTVTVRLPRNWKDTVWIEGRARFKLNDRASVSVTGGYQSPASPDETIDVTSPDGHRIIGGLGFTYDANRRLTFYGDARLQGILPREVTDSDYDLGNGRYTLFLAAAAVHARYRF